MSYMHGQASLLAATSHSAEVSRLKQSPERAEVELGPVKRQLEDKQGMLRLAVYFRKNE